MSCKVELIAKLALALVFSAVALASAQPEVVSVVPAADAFVRSMAPASNYGAGGSLSVSGAAAVNGSNQQNGLFDTLIRFATSNLTASLDSALGTQSWVVMRVRLLVTESATPDNAVFNRGVGEFEILCLAADQWIEGTGKPNAPTSDGVTWQDLPGLLNSNADVSLGVYTNTGVNGQDAFTLALAEPLIQEIRQGASVGFYLTARSPEIGFNFNSRNFGNTNAQPMLEVTAAANPNPQIDHIGRTGQIAVVQFASASNWTYRLQSTDALVPSQATNWSDLLVVPAQPVDGQVRYEDGVTNRWRFYRLSVSP